MPRSIELLALFNYLGSRSSKVFLLRKSYDMKLVVLNWIDGSAYWFFKIILVSQVKRWLILCFGKPLEMGFLVTTLIFIVVGVIASLLTRICCNRGPSANLYVDILSLLFFFFPRILLKRCMCECVRGYFLNHLVSEVLWLPWFFFQFLFVAFNLSYELSRLFGCSRTTCGSLYIEIIWKKKTHREQPVYRP